MIIEVHVFIPFQGQLRCRYDDKAHPAERIFRSDPDHDKRLIAASNATYDGGPRPPTCRELVFSIMRKEWEVKICDIIEMRVASYFKESEFDLYTHDFGPGLSLIAGQNSSIIGTFCRVSK